jgi:hypothetical protein
MQMDAAGIAGLMQRKRREREMFANVSTIRAAIFDVADIGWNGRPWHFDPADETDAQSEHRRAFAGAVIVRLTELQSPPHDGIRLQDLCHRHRSEALPELRAAVCVMCQAERRDLARDGVPR